jgi:hypothetical protein
VGRVGARSQIGASRGSERDAHGGGHARVSEPLLGPSSELAGGRTRDGHHVAVRKCSFPRKGAARSSLLLVVRPFSSLVHAWRTLQG